MRISRVLLVALLSSPAISFAGDDPATVKPVPIVALKRDKPVSYATDIHPIFLSKCVACHSNTVRRGRLNLINYEGLMKGGRNGSAIVPGKSGASLVVKTAGRTHKPFMPPPQKKDTQPLSGTELALIKRWIDEGAKPPAPGSLDTKVVLKPLSPAFRLIRSLVVSPDHSQVIAGHVNVIHIYDVKSGKLLRSLSDDVHAAIVESMALSPDGKILASGGFQQIALWDVQGGKLRTRITGLADRVSALAFLPDGKILAAGSGLPSEDGQLRLYNTADGKLIREISSAHSDTVFGVCFSPDGSKLASCSADTSIKIFETTTGKLIKVLEGHTHHVLDVAWRHDGEIIASAGADKTVRLWDYAAGEQLARINRGGGQITTIMLKHDTEVNRVMFVGKKSQLLTCSGANPAKHWTLEMTTRPGNYTANHYVGRSRVSFGDGRDYLYAAAASPDGALVATGGEGGVVRLYDAAGKLLKELAPAGR